MTPQDWTDYDFPILPAQFQRFDLNERLRPIRPPLRDVYVEHSTTPDSTTQSTPVAPALRAPCAFDAGYMPRTTAAAAPAPLVCPVPAEGFGHATVHAPEAARQFVRLARRPGSIADAGGGISRRLLLVGPPKGGKKTLARAIAAELHAAFSVLGGQSGDNAESLVRSLDALNTQSQTSQVRCIVYFDVPEGPRWEPDPETAMAARARWVQAWSSKAFSHLLLVVGVPTQAWVDDALEDAVVLQCRLRPPGPEERLAVWSHVLDEASLTGVEVPKFEKKTIERELVAPSDGLRVVDIRQALYSAIRSAILAAPDAASVTLTAAQLRDAIRHRRARRG